MSSDLDVVESCVHFISLSVILWMEELLYCLEILINSRYLVE